MRSGSIFRRQDHLCPPLQRSIRPILAILGCLLICGVAASQAAPVQSASELDYPPFARVTEDGQADGFAVELLRAAAAAMGREVKFRVGPWHAIKKDLADGRLDALPLVARTPDRAKIFDFTFPYLSMHGAVVIRRGDRRIGSAADLADKTVLVMRGDIAEEYVKDNHLSEHLITTVSLEKALRRLAAGEGDAMVVQALAGRKLIRELGLDLELVGEPLPNYQDFCFAVRSGDKKLLAELNEGLALVIADGTYERLRDRWLGPLLEKPTLPWPLIAAVVAISLLIAAGIAWLWQRTLVRQVSRRTAELDEANRRLAEEIAERKAAESKLRSHHEQLEMLVAERTTALQERSDRYELVLAGAQDAIWDWDVPAKRIHFSHQWKALRGLEDGEVSDSEEELSKYIHPDDAPRVLAAVQAHFDGQTPVFAEEYRICCKDGNCKWVFNRGLAWRDADGKVMRMAGSEHDITERRRAEEALQAREEYYRLLVEQAVDGIFLSDADGRYLEVNTAGAAMLGYTREEILGLRITDVLDPAEKPRIPEQVNHLASGEIVRSEWLFRRKDGSLFPGEVVGQQLPDGRLQAILRDISERHQAAEALREADRQKDEFLAMLAHELRNPLAPIRNAIEIMKLKGSTDPNVQAAREMIDRQVSHMVRLVDDLLDVSRITRGSLKLRKAQADLVEILNQVVDDSRPQFEKAGLALSVSLPSRPMCIDADPVRLAQVFSNLLHNARKFTPQGGEIRLTAEQQGSDLAVSVADNGIGIPAEALSGLFEMFTQLQADPGSPPRGLGIGLALSRRLVEMHGGSIEARSEGPGRGSEFMVRLPGITGICAPHLCASADPAAIGADTARRFLVVDDEADVRESLVTLLRLHGHEVEAAHDGLEAVESAARFRPDVILLDIGLPNLDGYSACRRIREHPWSKQMTIFALTGWGQDDDIRKTREAGFDHHLVKPVKLAEIQTLLDARDAESVQSDHSVHEPG